ncbi:ABC transporter substrate-binding protein [Oceanirhabdus sp. W0125-5]|uniref:ABC transporter substrate-binding protein n=1 Tax=Oceanirhabdus sp. W0125-5 TaxID=2999116 RepID=UPI0022F31EBA|nr:ABC transporter substrate-binding protein [Oceanirhabdus sp. W0125-5]WBW99117.1 ABC transporter substrate-binding protein [Oceanirhabdus sp. W0125-5]
MGIIKFKKSKNEKKDPILENVNVKELEDRNNRLRKLINKQKSQSILTERILKEAEDAIESTEVLLKSVEEINVQMDKHTENIDKTINVSAEVGAFSQEVCASVEESMGVVEESLSKAEEGKKSLDAIMESFLNIKHTVENMSEAMNKLSEKSNEIKGIVDIIKQISKTTHLLSLNANIEAAKAGEAGKGFTIVAQEVKKLANSSSDSADSINNIIDEMAYVTKETLGIVEKGVETVEESTLAVEKSGIAFGDIMTSIEKSKHISNQINQVMSEQADKNQYMLTVIDDMVKVSDMVKVFNENISINADKQKAVLNILESAIINLNEMSEENVNDLSNEISRFRIGLGKPSTFDPAMITDVESTKISSALHLGLAQFGIGTEVVGAIARTWHVEEDNLTWNFNLRRDMKFHNGRNITADDVKFSFERLLSKKLNSPNRWFLEMIDGADEYFAGRTSSVSGIRVEGKYNIKIRLKYAYNMFINNLAHCSCSILPKEEVDSKDIGLIGAGSFKFVSKTEDGLILEKFDEYSLGKALIDRIEIYFKVENAVDKFVAGELDYIDVHKNNIEKIKNEGYRPEKIQCVGARFLAMNFKNSNPVVHNKAVRQAINYCVDRDRIVKEVFGEMEIVSRGAFPNSLTSYRSKAYDRNLMKAKELMKSSGINSGTLTMSVSSGAKNHEKIAEILKDNLKEIGIQVKTFKVNGNYFKESSSNSNCDIFLYGWVGDSGTPDNFIQPLIDKDSAMNFGKYHNQEIVQMLEQARKTKNPYKYNELMNDIESKIIDDSPWIFLSTICSSYTHGNNIKGLKVHPLNVVKFNDIWIED